MDTKATNVDDPTDGSALGQGRQADDRGRRPAAAAPGTWIPNAKINMEDIDAELVRRSCDFIDRSVKAGQAVLSLAQRHAHACPGRISRTQVAGQERLSACYADAMMELDWEVGEILKKIDELGIADNTIVMFTSDNGAEIFTWPDGGNHPFRGEKGTTFEGGFRVPMVGQVARHHQARHHRQRDHRRTRIGCRPLLGCRR